MLARWQALDGLVTWVAVLDAQGHIAFANTALQDALGVSRKALVGVPLGDWFTEPALWAHALQGASDQRFATLRYDAWLQRIGAEALPVHVIVNRNDQSAETWVEMLPLEQQTRQAREDRATEQAQTNKELIRNLAHEIKNPLGGIRGAAQLLEMDMATPELRQYTQVIIHEADRLQSLVDRLLEPHRTAHREEPLNIHEVCERVCTLVQAEYAQGLQLVRDYDTSIPELLGDRGHLIQAVLNIAHNATQALAPRMAAGDARLTLRTRVQRQVTLGKQRHRLALQLHVVDNGPGVPPELQDRIFYPLVSGREGGSGLGLTLAQTYVQQHHGSITLESRPGHTDFTITLPLP